LLNPSISGRLDTQDLDVATYFYPTPTLAAWSYRLRGVIVDDQ
jgi:hypothetical protein